jgi:WD40 repeat protein
MLLLRLSVLIPLLYLLFQLTGYSQIPRIVIDSKGHNARINNIHFTADGSRIVTVSEDKTIKIWELESGRMLRKFESQIGQGPEGMFYASALAPDGNTLAVAGYKVNSEKENYILLIDLEKGEQIATAIGHTDVVNALAFSGDGRHLASGSADQTIKVWKLSGQHISVLSTVPVNGIVSSLSFNPKTHDLAVAFGNRDVLVYPFATLEQGTKKATPRVFRNHRGSVEKVLYSPDGSYLASASLDNELLLWKSDGALLKDFGPLTDAVYAMAFSSDSKILVGLNIQGRGVSWAINSLTSRGMITRFSARRLRLPLRTMLWHLPEA